MSRKKEYGAEYYLKNRTERRVHKMFAKCNDVSRRKGIEVTITKDWIREKMALGFCEMSGLAFDLSYDTGFRQNPFCPSIDRINPKKGYVPENCRMVLWILNQAMSEYGIDMLTKVVNAVKTNTTSS